MKDIGVVAKISSLDDYFWQNNKNVDMYQYLKKDIGYNVPLIDSKRFAGKKEVDIEKMPGYEKQVGGIWYGAVWQMWFNKPYYKYVDKTAIESFNDCFINEKLNNDCIHIQLYEHMEDYEKPENRRRQWAFKDAIGFEDVIRKAQEDFEQQENNPMAEINLGKFEHGGVKEMRTYLTEKDEITPRSFAEKVEITEYNEKGKIVYREVVSMF